MEGSSLTIEQNVGSEDYTPIESPHMEEAKVISNIMIIEGEVGA